MLFDKALPDRNSSTILAWLTQRYKPKLFLWFAPNFMSSRGGFRSRFRFPRILLAPILQGIKYKAYGKNSLKYITYYV